MKSKDKREGQYIDQRVRYGAAFFLMLILFFILLFLNIRIGSVSISLPDIVHILFSGDAKDTAYQIIWQIRLPRVCMAIVLGGALSLSGFLLQIYFQNPIAGPYILGISSGAKMFVALTLIVLIQKIGRVNSVVMILSAFAGAMMSIAFVLLLARKIHHMSVLLIGGIMINYICSAITDFIVTFADDSNIVNLHGWSLGSFSGSNWRDCYIAVVVVMVSVVLTFLLSKQIQAYQLGEAYAQSVGVDVRRFRIYIILLSSFMAACVTAFAGPVSFVGIAVPHLVKRGFGTTKPLIIIPACYFAGGIFCMLCDLIARTLFAPTELNIGTVTAIFGAPIVIWMLLKRKRSQMQ